MEPGTLAFFNKKLVGDLNQNSRTISCIWICAKCSPVDSDCRVNSVPARQFGEIADFLSELQIPHHNCRAQIEDRKALVFQDIDTSRKLKLYFIKSSVLNMKLWFYSFGLFNQLLKQVKIYHE